MMTFRARGDEQRSICVGASLPTRPHLLTARQPRMLVPARDEDDPRPAGAGTLPTATRPGLPSTALRGARESSPGHGPGGPWLTYGNGISIGARVRLALVPCGSKGTNKLWGKCCRGGMPPDGWVVARVHAGPNEQRAWRNTNKDPASLAAGRDATTDQATPGLRLRCPWGHGAVVGPRRARELALLSVCGGLLGGVAAPCLLWSLARSCVVGVLAAVR